jgi:hypothetical protein
MSNTFARLSVEDRLAIAELMARYNHAVDSGDVESYVATFVEDGVLDVGIRQFKGRDELAQVAHHGGQTRGQHVTSNLMIDGDGSDATARSYGQMFVVSGEASVSAVGTFEDVLRKDNGRWQFVRRSYRRVVPIESSPSAQDNAYPKEAQQ